MNEILTQVEVFHDPKTCAIYRSLLLRIQIKMVFPLHIVYTYFINKKTSLLLTLSCLLGLCQHDILPRNRYQ